MDPKTCPGCGKDIHPDDPQGLCAECLLKTALTESFALPCASCGNLLEDEDLFCPQCGAASSAQETEAGKDSIRAALETKLHGQYRLIRLLGRGGMGSVYLARDLALEREVAIKVVKTEGREIYDRLRREAKTAARLSHPNIVPLHAFDEVEGMPFFVMGYVRGESLAARLRRDGKVPEEEGRRIIAEIADALDHAHKQGIVHRDVKPDNVLLEDESGRALLTDFGVAKPVEKDATLMRTGVVGTPHYMSPEQVSGRADIDGRSDIYSLGVLAYAALCGRLPFEGSSAADIMSKHLSQQAPALRVLDPSLSESSAQTIERCLAKDPAQRWPDARTLKLALGVLEEIQMPDALRGAQSKGIPALGITLAFSLFYGALMRGAPYNDENAWWAPILMSALTFGMGLFSYAFVVLRMRREGFSFRQSQSAIWREPSWWLWWYPRSLRRPGNVYDRLSISVRVLRGAIFGFVLFTWMMIFSLTFVGDRAVTSDVPGRQVRFQPVPRFSIPLVLFIVVWICSTILAKRELKRKGLGPSDIQRVMLTMPLSRVSFWSRPHIDEILENHRGTETGVTLQ